MEVSKEVVLLNDIRSSIKEEMTMLDDIIEKLDAIEDNDPEAVNHGIGSALALHGIMTLMMHSKFEALTKEGLEVISKEKLN